MKVAKGVVLRVIDGDTVLLAVRCRLSGVRAPELGTSAGAGAKATLEAAWPERSSMRFRAVAVDDYNRLIIAPES